MNKAATPNHALQRTPGIGVQLPSAALIRPAQSRAVLPAMKPGTARAFASRRRAHTRAPGPESLSLGSLGDLHASHAMKAFWAPLFAAGFILSAHAEPNAAAIQVPKSFLQTDHVPAQRLLAIEVAGNFKEVTIPEAIDFMKSKLRDVDVGYRINIDIALEEPVPRFTRQFKKVPLRTFFYLLSHDAGLTIEWVYENGLPTIIRIRRP